MMEEVPVKQKVTGRKVNLNMQVWEAQVKDTLMAGLTAKFQQNPHLAHYLVNTGEKSLVEANDNIWGNGLSLYHKEGLNPMAWKGQNRLGISLEQVRTQMK